MRKFAKLFLSCKIFFKPENTNTMFIGGITLTLFYQYAGVYKMPQTNIHYDKK